MAIVITWTIDINGILKNNSKFTIAEILPNKIIFAPHRFSFPFKNKFVGAAILIFARMIITER